MEPGFIDFINDTQKYTSNDTRSEVMPSECMYRMLMEILPKYTEFLRYIKSKNEGKYNTDLVELVATYFTSSRKEAIEYIDILHTKGKVQHLRDILSKFGFEEQQIEKLLKVKVK
jgi:hypothetical protein